MNDFFDKATGFILTAADKVNAYKSAEAEEAAAQAAILRERVVTPEVVLQAPSDNAESFLERNRNAVMLGGAGLIALGMLLVAVKVIK